MTVSSIQEATVPSSLSSSKSTDLSSIPHTKPFAKFSSPSTLLHCQPMRWVLFLSPLAVEKTEVWKSWITCSSSYLLINNRSRIQFPVGQMLDTVLSCHSRLFAVLTKLTKWVFTSFWLMERWIPHTYSVPWNLCFSFFLLHKLWREKCLKKTPNTCHAKHLY